LFGILFARSGNKYHQELLEKGSLKNDVKIIIKKEKTATFLTILSILNRINVSFIKNILNVEKEAIIVACDPVCRIKVLYFIRIIVNFAAFFGKRWIGGNNLEFHLAD